MTEIIGVEHGRILKALFQNFLGDLQGKTSAK